MTRILWHLFLKGNASLQKRLAPVSAGRHLFRPHKHETQDEVFIVYKGRLTIRLRSGDVELEEGDMFVVPRGVEHAPKADEPAEFMVLGIDVTSNEEGGNPAWSYGGGAPPGS